MKFIENYLNYLKAVFFMILKDKFVLVTGAEGFIGSHLVEKLLSIGANVTAMVKNNFKEDIGFLTDMPKNNKLKICMGDLNDYDAVYDLCKNIEVVFHLGAEISVPYSYKHPRTFVNTNINGTLNVLTSARENKAKRVILMSTSEVYGTPDSIPIKETHTLKGQSPYSATKIAAEKLAESFHLSYGLPVVIVRAFNTYGPRQSSRAIIPTIITQALFKDKILVGNVKPTRDFNFVEDTAEGLIKAAEEDSLVGEVVNIGTGKEISIGDLTRKILQLTGSKATIEKEDLRLRPNKSEVMRLCADNSKMKEKTGWTPRTSFDIGLKKTIEWIKKNPNHFKIGVYQI
jgi:dTDP-glucose 4,6-dehydratase